MSKPKVDAAERFRSKVTDGPSTDCWPYTGTLNAQGHGVFWVDGRAAAPADVLVLAGQLEE